MFDDEQAHKKKMHEMNWGSQRMLCLLITSGFCSDPAPGWVQAERTYQ